MQLICHPPAQAEQQLSRGMPVTALPLVHTTSCTSTGSIRIPNPYAILVVCHCSHIIQRLLAAGHIVHGTARHPCSARGVSHLQAMEGAAERLKLFKANLMAPGDFHEAVAGCDVVIHTASPYQLDVPAGEDQRLHVAAQLMASHILGSGSV